MPFYGIYRQLRVMTIEGECLSLEFWVGGKFTPGKSEGQEHIGDNIIRPAAAEKGGVCYPAG